MKTSTFSTILATSLLLGESEAFAPTFTSNSNSITSTRTSTTRSTELHFGIPTFGAKDDKEDKKDAETANTKMEEKKIGMSGLVQLVTAGMGAAFLGEFEGVEKDTGKMMFSLEANNLVDEDGNSKQTSMPYFESGWVDEKDLEKEEQKKKNGGGGFKFW